MSFQRGAWPGMMMDGKRELRSGRGRGRCGNGREMGPDCGDRGEPARLMTGAVKRWWVGGEVLLLGSGGIWASQLPLLAGEPQEEGSGGSSVGEARHGYSHGRWTKATGHRAQGRGTAQAHRALGDGPTFNPVCTSSGPVKTAPARKEGAVGLWDAPALRIQNAGCHFNFHSVSRKQR